MDISVIIPTTANKTRGPFLTAAIDSLFAQSEHRAVPIIVINGASFVPELLAALRADTRLRVLYREEPGEMAALVAGRQSVDTEYFGVLDDDDLYLPNAFAVRIGALRGAAQADAIVTNGFRRTAGGDELLLEEFGKIGDDPLGMLMRQCWMTPAGALFRTAAIGAEFFAVAPAMLEYTYIGLRIALSGKICFADQPTFIKQDLLVDAITRSNEYALRQPQAIEQLMATLALPPAIHRQLKEKLAASCHHASTIELRERRLYRAWRAHLRSLQSVHGLRYLSYTRHLLEWPLQAGRRCGLLAPAALMPEGFAEAF